MAKAKVTKSKISIVEAESSGGSNVVRILGADSMIIVELSASPDQLTKAALATLGDIVKEHIVPADPSPHQ